MFRRVSEKLSKLPNNGGKPIIRLLDNVSNVDDFIYTRGKSIYFNPAYFNFLSKNAPSLNSVMDRLDLLFTEEIIHLASLNLLTNQEVNDIYNELTDKEIKAVNKLYTKGDITKLSKENLVHEYIRIIAQDIIQGKTSELYVGKNYENRSALYKFLVKLFNFVLDAYNSKPNTNASKIAINRITNFINTKSNFADTLWNENKDVILSNNSDTTYEVFNQMYQEFGLDFINDFINKCKK